MMSSVDKIYNQELEELFTEMRKSQLYKKYESSGVINCPQPGYFGGNAILFIGQNPAYPKPDKIQSDKILLNPNTSNSVFHRAYLDAQLEWHFYNFFISKFISSFNFSIINSSFYPTKNNYSVPEGLILDNLHYIEKIIHILRPKNMVVCGRQAKYAILRANIDRNKLNIIYTPHYAYWMRAGYTAYEQEIKRIKELLK